MLIWAKRTAQTLTLRALFYGGLFVAVVLVNGAITSALRAAGWGPGYALAASGAAVLGLVLLALQAGEFIHKKRAEAREVERVRQRLPSGPCCVVWRASEGGEAEMPWDMIGHLRAPFPKLAAHFGVEGLAVVDFEIGAGGVPKNIHCVDSWPSDVFYEAARAALAEARFQAKPGAKPRAGVSYRMPFVFRIAGAARLKERGRRARPLRPAVRAAQKAVAAAQQGVSAAAETVEKIRRKA